MNVWIRVFSNVETEGLNTEGSSLTLKAVTCLSIYLAEHLARGTNRPRRHCAGSFHRFPAETI